MFEPLYFVMGPLKETDPRAWNVYEVTVARVKQTMAYFVIYFLLNILQSLLLLMVRDTKITSLKLKIIILTSNSINISMILTNYQRAI